MQWIVIRIKYTLQLQDNRWFYERILANFISFRAFMNALVDTETDQMSHTVSLLPRALTTEISDCLTKSGNDCGWRESGNDCGWRESGNDCGWIELLVTASA